MGLSSRLWQTRRQTRTTQARLQQINTYIKQFLADDPERAGFWENRKNPPETALREWGIEKLSGDEILARLGHKAPPFHPHCRTTLVASFETHIFQVIQNNATGDTKKVVENSLGAIDTVHLVSKVPKTPINEIDKPNENFKAKFIYNKETGKPLQILFNKGIENKTKELSIIHEIGHLLDTQMLGEKGLPASISHENLIEFRNAIKQTKAIQTLWKIKREGRFSDGKPIDNKELKDEVKYLLTEPEIFARAYTQYIVKKSKNLELQKQIQSILENKVELYRLSYWKEDDFLQVEKVLEKIFKEGGLLK